MIESFFQSLKDNEARYLLIRGQATVLYGAATLSEDIHLWIGTSLAGGAPVWTMRSRSSRVKRPMSSATRCEAKSRITSTQTNPPTNMLPNFMHRMMASTVGILTMGLIVQLGINLAVAQETIGCSKRLNAGDLAAAPEAADQAVAADLKLLQGTWEGVDVGDPSRQRITITITDTSLHFYRDKTFWFKTTFTLSAGTDPKRLHATIKESADRDSKGEVVGAIFKIEDETFTLASYGTDNDDPPKTFAEYPSHYVLRKVASQKKNAEASRPESPKGQP